MKMPKIENKFIDKTVNGTKYQIIVTSKSYGNDNFFLAVLAKREDGKFLSFHGDLYDLSDVSIFIDDVMKRVFIDGEIYTKYENYDFVFYSVAMAEHYIDQYENKLTEYTEETRKIVHEISRRFGRLSK